MERLGKEFTHYRVRVPWSVTELLLYNIFWLLLSLIYVGILFAPAMVMCKILNGVEIYNINGDTVGVVQVRPGFRERVGELVLWGVLGVLTLGVLLIVFVIIEYRNVFKNIKIVSLAGKEQSELDKARAEFNAI